MAQPRSLRVKCRGTRRDGTPCQSWAAKGGVVCRLHGGAAPAAKAAAVKRRAAMAQFPVMTASKEEVRKRLDGLAERAISALEAIIEDPMTPVQQKRRAAETIMNRTGLPEVK